MAAFSFLVRVLRHCHPFFAFAHRLMAGGLAALVLLLAALAVAPELHHELHAEHPPSEDGCAVVLFAGGVPLAVATIEVPALALVWHDQSRLEVTDLFLASPRYLRQPERGPPVS